MQTKASSVAARCAVAVAACTGALLVKWILGPVIVPSAFLTFYAAVLVSAWFAGRAGGLLATLLSAVVGTVLFLPPVYPPLGAETITDLRVVLFVLISAVLSWG